MMDPRQSTTLPKVSKTHAFTAATGFDFWARKATAAAPIHADFTSCLRVMSGPIYYSRKTKMTSRGPLTTMGSHSIMNIAIE